MSDETLIEFENLIMENLLLGNISPKVTNGKGETPIIVCLDSQPLSVLFSKVELIGGCATIYSLSNSGKVRILAVLPSACALSEDPVFLRDGEISLESSIGLFIDYIVSQEGKGVATSSKVSQKIDKQIKSFGQADLIAC